MPGRNKRKKRDELGPASAGQSGNLQQLSHGADADSESVEELVAEGNAFEAEAVKGVENAEPPDLLRSQLAKYRRMMYQQSTYKDDKDVA